ncbi:MAG: hypothetical protein E6H04_09950 [Bacillati bacterium ANGP1]|uniref:Uncharacterized protein n=1 Tax=Candidatus Segetimicrobium genomatis TaxID=2569760 RepID=A0A537J896_9BACT|nr:MAG: hypothetical protein E6H04_09950 [Terrabacteria group bacterium ANGP1]
MVKVEKSEVHVLIYTATHKIEGTYFMHPGSRLIDDLNGHLKRFIPLREVSVTNLRDETEVLFKSDFVAVNVEEITLFSPGPDRQPRREKRVALGISK